MPAVTERLALGSSAPTMTPEPREASDPLLPAASICRQTKPKELALQKQKSALIARIPTKGLVTAASGRPPSNLKFGHQGDLSPAFWPPVQPSALFVFLSSQSLNSQVSGLRPLFLAPQLSSLIARPPSLPSLCWLRFASACLATLGSVQKIPAVPFAFPRLASPPLGP